MEKCELKYVAVLNSLLGNYRLSGVFINVAESVNQMNHSEEVSELDCLIH